MIFLITLGLIFIALVVARGIVKIRQANDVIEGATHEVDRARQERTEIHHEQFASNSDWPGYRGYDNYGVSRS